MTSPPTMRFLTWNVHGCVGRDGVCDPDRVANVLEAAQPDITALQEIDNRTTSAARDPVLVFRLVVRLDDRRGADAVRA